MAVDRRRRFTLPGIQDLNKDQDEALALPTEGRHLIIGGPGTGKSVVTLLRARRLKEQSKMYGTLVYNRLLHHSNRHLFGSGQSFAAMTWEQWFRRHFKKRLSMDIPTLEPEAPGGYSPIDWEAVRLQTQHLDNVESQHDKFLVIDEGQDMPPAFYQALIQLGFKNFYVAADQNQQIHPDKCSSRQDLENCLAIEPDEVLELKINYRNTRPIAQLARHFYPDDPASPRPDLPVAKQTAMTPELWTYGGKNLPALEDIAGRILRLGDRDPRKLIGIITPNNNSREKFIRALNVVSSGVENSGLDNGKPPIQTYFSGCRNQLDFSQGGLMVINAQSCKGLEFDIAILADIDQHKPENDPFMLKVRFYVMVSRAREQVIMLRTAHVCPVVDELLPDNPAILVRK